MAESSRWRRFWRRAREIASVMADFWDAIKLAAFFGALIVAGVVGAVLFAVTVVPPGFLAMLLIGVTGLSFIALVPVARKLLPTPPPPPPLPPAPVPAVQAQPDAAAQARMLDQRIKEKQATKAAEERVIRLRRAARLVREELLDNAHLLGEIKMGDRPVGDVILDIETKEWMEYEDALLEHENAEPHTCAKEAYRQIRRVWRTQYRRKYPDSKTLERDPEADEPLGSDIVITEEAIAVAVKALKGLET